MRFIALSTWIRTLAICCVWITSSALIWAFWPRNGGILRVVPNGKMSCMVNPLSAIIETLAKSRYYKERQVDRKKRKGLIPRQRNTSRETVYAKYGWLHMNNFFEFSLREQKIRFASE